MEPHMERDRDRDRETHRHAHMDMGSQSTQDNEKWQEMEYIAYFGLVHFLSPCRQRD